MSRWDEVVDAMIVLVVVVGEDDVDADEDEDGEGVIGTGCCTKSVNASFTPCL